MTSAPVASAPGTAAAAGPVLTRARRANRSTHGTLLGPGRVFADLLVERDGGIAWVTLSRPSVHNALNLGRPV